MPLPTFAKIVVVRRRTANTPSVTPLPTNPEDLDRPIRCPDWRQREPKGVTLNRRLQRRSASLRGRTGRSIRSASCLGSGTIALVLSTMPLHGLTVLVRNSGFRCSKESRCCRGPHERLVACRRGRGGHRRGSACRHACPGATAVRPERLYTAELRPGAAARRTEARYSVSKRGGAIRLRRLTAMTRGVVRHTDMTSSLRASGGAAREDSRRNRNGR